MPLAKIVFDFEYLRSLYQESPDTLLEMAAPSYLHPNPLIRWIVARRMQIALNFLDFKPEQTVLDFGCGAGILLLQLPKGAGSYFGVDLDIQPGQKMLAHHKRDDVKLLPSEGWEEAFADGSLDAITALEVLEHVDELTKLLAVFKRKLAVGGKLVVSGPTENAFYRIARKISGFSGHYHLRDIFEIQAGLRSVGFIETNRSWLPLPGFLALFSIVQYKVVSG